MISRHLGWGNTSVCVAAPSEEVANSRASLQSGISVGVGVRCIRNDALQNLLSSKELCGGLLRDLSAIC